MPYRLRLHGDTDSAKLLLPTARKVLGELNRDMAFGGLKQLQKTVKLASGAVINVSNVLGQETINIMFPEAKEVKEEVVEEYNLELEYRIQLTNTVDDEVVSVDKLSRFTLFKSDATSLNDEDKKVFEYLVPEGTSPEEYFGSDENLGLQWHDEDEYFFVESDVIDDEDFDVFKYATLAGFDEPKYFLVYSCFKGDIGDNGDNGDYELSTEDQQYKSVSDDEDRWLEADLISPCPNSEVDYYEDLIQCGGQYYVVAEFGTPARVVIWDVAIKRYIQGVVDDNSSTIVDADWPVLKSDLDDWYALTSLKRHSNLYAGIVDCSDLNLGGFCLYNFYAPYTCSCSESGGSLESTCFPGLFDTLFTTCTVLNSCPPYPAAGEQSMVYTVQAKSAQRICQVPAQTTINGYTVINRKHTYCNNYIYQEEAVAYDKIWDESDLEVFTFMTPWGNLFSIDSSIDTRYYRTGLAADPVVCEGYFITYHADISELDYDEFMYGKGFKIDNVLFIAFYGFYKTGMQENEIDGIDGLGCALGAQVEYEYKLGAKGTMGYYSNLLLDSVNPNEMPGNQYIEEGLINLIQTEFDAAEDLSSIKVIDFTLREDLYD